MTCFRKKRQGLTVVVVVDAVFVDVGAVAVAVAADEVVRVAAVDLRHVGEREEVLQLVWKTGLKNEISIIFGHPITFLIDITHLKYIFATT